MNFQTNGNEPMRGCKSATRAAALRQPRRYGIAGSPKGKMALSAAVLLSGLSLQANAATIYWNGVNSNSLTNGWNSVTSWSTASAATTPNPSAVPGSGDTAYFNITTVTSTQVVDLNAAQSVGAIQIGTSGTAGSTTIQSGTGGTASTLTLGGSITTRIDGSATIVAPLILSAASQWTAYNYGVTTDSGTVTGSGSLTLYEDDAAGDTGFNLSGGIKTTGSITNKGATGSIDDVNSVIGSTVTSVTCSSGNLVLGGVNLYTGPTSISGSTAVILLSAGGNLGVNSAVTNTGTLDTNGSSFTIGSLAGSGVITATAVTAGTDTITIGSLNNNTTFSGTISGGAGTGGTAVRAIAIATTGTGSFTLSGANTYVGGTSIPSGSTLVVSNSTGSATGTAAVALSGTLSSGIGNVGFITGKVTAAAGSVISPGGVGGSGSSGILTLSGGLTTVSGATLNFMDLGTGTGDINNGDMIALGSSTPTIASNTIITFNTGVTAAGNDYQLISGTNVGTLNLSNFSLPAAPSGQGYQLSTSIDSNVIDLVVTGTAANLIWNDTGGSGTGPGGTADGITWDNGVNQNWNNGTGSAFFSSVNQDNVTFNDNNAGNFNVVVNGGVTVTPGSMTFNSHSTYNLSGGGTIGGPGGLTLTGTGTVNFGVVGTFTGNTNVASGTLNLQNSLALQNSTLISGHVTFDAAVGSNAFTFGGLSGSGNIALQNTAAGPIAVSVGNNNAGTTFSGVLSGLGSLVKIGSGTLTMAGSNTYTGGTTLASGVLNLAVGENPGVSGPMGETGPITFGGGILQFSSSNQYDYSSRFSTAGNQPFIIDTAGQNVTFATGLNSSGGSLNKIGAGTLILSGTSSYTGTTTISAGTLQIGATNALPAASTVIFPASTTLNLNGFSTSAAGLTIAQGVTATLGSGTLNIGSGSIIFQGTSASTSDLTGGTISINGGTIDASAAGGNSVGGGLIDTVDSQITGTGGLTLNAFGNTADNGGGSTSLFTLTNTSNSFTGGVTISAGQVNVTAGDGIFGNAINASTNAISIASSAGLVAGSSATLNSSSIVLTGAGNHYFRTEGSTTTLTLNGSISDGGAGAGLYKTDAGTLTLGGSNTYTGATSVPDGTVNVTGNETAATGSWNIGIVNTYTATVTFSSGSTIVVAGGNTIQIGNTAQAGGGNETLNATSDTVTDIGTLYVGRSGNLNLNSGANWNQNGGMSVNGAGGYGSSMTVNTGASFNYTGSTVVSLNATNGTNSAGGPILDIAGGTFTTDQAIQETPGTGGAIGTIFLNSGGTLGISANIASLVTGSSTAPLQLNGGSGVINTNNYNTTIGSVISGSGNLTKAGSGALTLAATNTYTGGTTVNAGGLVLGAGLPSAGTGSVITVNGGGLVIQGSTSLATVNALVASGYANAAWNGSTGINSAAAATNSAHLTALGAIVNDNGSGTTLYSTFEGAPTNDGDILVKYTYYGDTNLDGKVDGTDYSRIDAGALANMSTAGSATGWFNGDFNYDGVINGSDYTLIDNAYNTQGALISAEIATPTAEIVGSGAVSAVPEPASLGLLGMGLAGLLGRRRRQ